jgi:hypothetical protein
VATNDTPNTPDNDPNAHLRRDRNSTGRFVRSLDTVRRDAAAAEYLADHPGATYEEIKERYGYAHRSDAKKAIERAKADVARPAITKLIATESEELDALYTEACAILRRRHITSPSATATSSRGSTPRPVKEEPLLDDGPKLAAIREMRAIRESYRKLLGVDQPTQVAVSGAVRYEVVGVDPADLS